MGTVFDIDTVNRLGNEEQYAKLIAYIDSFVKEDEPDAIAILGICYDFGYGVSQNHDKAMRLFEKSANLGSAIGQYHYGWYLTGEDAIEWKKKAALQGCVPAQTDLAMELSDVSSIYLDWYRFLNVEVDYKDKTIDITGIHDWELLSEKAKYIIRTAAENGHISAQYELASFFERNENTKDEAIYWYEKVANAPLVHTNVSEEELVRLRINQIAPQTQLCYKEQFQWLNHDRNMKLICLEKCLINVWIRSACERLGLHYFYDKNLDRSKYWFSKVLEIENDDMAHYFLGVIKYKCATETYNYDEAFEHFNAVSEESHCYLDASLYLALCYYYGYGTKKNPNKAFECFEKASNAETKEGCLAKYYVGLCYYDGDGVPVDKNRAIELFNEAASDENDSLMVCGKACFFLGYLYETGKEVPQDNLKACELYKRGLLSSYSPVEMLSVRDMLIEYKPEEKLLKHEIEVLESFVDSISKKLKKSQIASFAINKHQTTISNTLDEFTKEILDFVEKQKVKVRADQNHEDVDIGAISNAIIDKVDSIKQKDTHSVFQEVGEELKAHFGGLWRELDPNTRRALITAQGLFVIMQSKNAEELDYSGICVMVCSALENELKIRFVNGYRLFLENNYGRSHDNLFPETWPRFMQQKGKPQIRKWFTLGDAIHIYSDHEKEGCDKLRIFEKYLNSIRRGQIFIQAKEFSENFLSLCANLISIRNNAAHAGSVSYKDACNVLGIVEENEDVYSVLDVEAANKELRGAKGLIFELISITKNPIKVN